MRWRHFATEPPGESDLQKWQSLSGITGLALVIGPALWRKHAFLWALDIEAEHRAEGEAWLDQHAPGWRDGLVVETGGGGLHVYCLAPCAVRTRRCPWGEIRGEGALCVLPPSVHPETGRPYRWLSRGQPVRLNPGDVPVASPNGRATGAGVPVEVLGEPIPEGRRNQTLTSIAGSLRARGCDPATLEAVLLAVNEARCDPPLPAEEVRGIARSVSRYEPRSGPEPESPPTLRLVSLETVECRPLRWLWPGRIPLGKLTLLDGDPGLGKSLLALDLAARLTTGRPLPDGSRPALEGPAHVLILTAEDGLADTVKPRLLAAGGDPARVTVLEAVRRLILPDEDGAPQEVWEPPTLADVEALRQALTMTGAGLLIVDPLSAYLPATMNAWNDAQARRLLRVLADLAEETGAAILALRHLTKTPQTNPLYRGQNSIAFIAAARSGLLVAPDPDDPSGRRRVLAVTKTNLTEPPPSLAYEIEATAGVPRLAWRGQTAHSARSLLGVPGDPDERSALDDACAFLHALLAQGPVEARRVLAEARQAGISDMTLRRAKARLGVRSVRDGSAGETGRWLWALPPSADESKVLKQADDQPKMLNNPGMSILGPDEHLKPPDRLVSPPQSRQEDGLRCSRCSPDEHLKPPACPVPVAENTPESRQEDGLRCSSPPKMLMPENIEHLKPPARLDEHLDEHLGDPCTCGAPDPPVRAGGEWTCPRCFGLRRPAPEGGGA